MSSRKSLKSLNSIFSDAPSESDFQLPSSKIYTERDYKNYLNRKGAQKMDSKRFLFELRKAFDDADAEQKGWISHDQWMNSSLRFYILDGKLSETEFDKYFRKIDANSDEKLTWEELVCYMIQEITTRELKIDNENTRLITKVPMPPPPRDHQHRDMIRRLIINKRTGDYTTLSTDSIRFWNSADLSLKHVITNPGYFADFYIYDNFFIMVVATTERRLLFYELEKYSVLPVEICASPSTKSIKMMNIEEAQNTLKALDSPQIPMFNVPKVISEADYPKKDPNSLAFFIGDDDGIVELFQLLIPQRRKGTDYIVERVGRSQIHTESILEIKPIQLLNCYASSSSDRTLKFWQYTGSTFSIIKTFTDYNPIHGFIFLEQQKALITYGASRDVFVWGINPPRKIFTLGDHYNQVQCISEFATTSKESYLVVITNRKEFRIWDSTSYRLVNEWVDHSLQRPENLFSVAQFDYNRLCLVACSAYPSKWAEDFTTQLIYFEPVTHNYPIVGCFYSSEYDQLITCDSVCTIKVWNYMNGTIETAHKQKRTFDSPNILAACLDNSSRRLVTTTYNGQISIWNFNSGQEIVKFTPNDHSLISIFKCVIISNREYLVCCRWDRKILLFIETDPCEYELYRSFNGHKSDITSIAQSIVGLVSGDASGAVISWAINTSSPQAIGYIASGAMVECIECANYQVFVGDSNGAISIFALPKMNLITTFDAHGITRPYSLSSIVADENNDALYSADNYGYVKKYQLSNLENGQIYRCHQDDIISLTLVNGGKHIATCGVDKTVRIWDTDTFGYYGFLNEEGNHWSLIDGDIEGDIVKYHGKLARPFEIDDQHFVQVFRPPLKMNSTDLLIKKMRRQSIMKMSKVVLASNRDINVKITPENIIPEVINEPEEEEFTLKKFTETIDEFMQDMNQKNSKRILDKAKSEFLSKSITETSTVTQPDRQLQTTTRPTELIHQIQNLCSKSYRGETGKLIVSSLTKPSNSITTHLKNFDINILKPTKRPPRLTKKNASQSLDTFGSDHLPLSLNIV